MDRKSKIYYSCLCKEPSSPFLLSGREQLVPAPHSPGPQTGSQKVCLGIQSGEKNIRQVPSSSCCLLINTRLLVFDLPVFPSFYLKRDASWLKMGN